MNCLKCGKEMKKLGDTGFVTCMDCNGKQFFKRRKLRILLDITLICFLILLGGLIIMSYLGIW